MTSIDQRATRSLLDVWVDAIDRLPVPSWSVYVAIGGASLALQAALSAGAGIGIEPFAAYFAVAGIYAIGLLHHLRRSAASAFDAFRPSIPSSVDADRLRADLLAMPAGLGEVVPGGAAFVALLVLFAGGPLERQVAGAGLADTPVAIAFNLVLYAFNWAATAILLLGVVRRSMMMDRVIRAGKVDLFDQAPLYAFSWLSARSSLGLALMFYAPVLILSAQGEQVALTALRIGVAVVLLAVFIWPLWGAHMRLRAERHGLLARSLDRTQVFYAELHERFERGERGVPDGTRNEIDTLEREQRMLRAVPTWPWSSDVVPTVMGAIVLPLIFSVLVSVAQRLVPG
jgi:hypothetical protein